MSEGGGGAVPRQRRAFSSFAGPVETGGDPEVARVLAGMFKVDPGLARALTHGFHSYAGRMHPSMARAAIACWSRPGDRVLDPFCGSGTVLVEAMAAGRVAVGIDASPLAVMLAGVRLTCLAPAERDRLVAVAAQMSAASVDQARKRKRPESPAWARHEFRRFHPHVALELLGLRQLVMETQEDAVGRALRMCFSSILVKFMKSGPEAPRDGEAKRIGRGVPSHFFARRAEELARGLAALDNRTGGRVLKTEVSLGDARAYPALRGGTFDLVLSSPPYAGTYDYAEQHEVRFTWLGLPQTVFRRKQIGERLGSGGPMDEAWHESRRRWLSEMKRVIKPGGHIVLVVGDGVVAGRAEDARQALAELAPTVGLAAIAWASSLRPTRDRRLGEIFGRMPRREHVVLLSLA